MPRVKGDGGPAFPTTKTEYVNTGRSVYKEKVEVKYDGMTLRDYFAAKALNGLVSSERNSHFADKVEVCAEEAYGYADAMLKAREVKDA